MKLVIASHNKGKIAEITALLADLPIELSTQADYDIGDIPETATTFIGNALLKAHYVSERTGLAVLADDSGLEINSLQGAPGIYSARYAGDTCDFQRNIDKVLHELAGVEDRRAQFRSVCVLLKHPQDPAPFIAEGVWAGHILLDRRGHGGFGYDAIFYSPELGKSAAELTALEKNCLSHRAMALQRIKQHLTNPF